MNFDSVADTDDLLLILPPNENDRWEFKSSSIIADRGKFSSELGKQVSAFANSGGGNLVLGIADKTRAIEPCEQFVGRQSTKDWLSTMVESSVEYPIRQFRIHEIPCSGDPTKSVYVVAVDDSPAAPHQAKADRIYYYRIDGHTKAAPHFHVELLRNRMTKAVVEIGEMTAELKAPELARIDRYGIIGDEICTELRMNIQVQITNRSHTLATAWGIEITSSGMSEFWTITNRSDWRASRRKICVRGSGELLPQEESWMSFDLTNRISTMYSEKENHGHEVLQELTGFQLMLRPVSQNYYGEANYFGCEEPNDTDGLQLRDFKRQLFNAGCTFWENPDLL